ncbi:MAG: SDR family oxidoreductase [Pseudomonadota bacterium]
MDIAGKAAFVSGGSGALGRRICLALAEAGADVAVGWSGGGDRMGEVCAEVRRHGRLAHPVRHDLRDPATLDKAVAHTAKALGRLDFLINASGAAGGPPGDLEALNAEAWDRLHQINLRGPYLLARAAAPHLRAARGAIVNIGSTIGLGTWGADLPYMPSKSAVVGLTRFLAASLAPEVRVNCVAPGLMENTEMSRGASDAFVARWREAAALGATTSLEDVTAQVLAFLRSDTITGQTLVVDGGLTFR